MQSITKKCKTCGEILPIEQFYKHKDYIDGRQARCKICICLASREKREKNIDKSLAYEAAQREKHLEKRRSNARKYYWENREKIRASYASSPKRKPNPEVVRKSKYKIQPGTYGKMLLEQRGRCAICNKESIKLFIDHDHGTGKVRGLLCRSCNMALGFLRDDVAALKNAIDYLSKKD